MVPVSKKGVRPLGVRERIHAIRLMEKVNKNPAAGEKLGIIVMNGQVIKVNLVRKKRKTND